MWKLSSCSSGVRGLAGLLGLLLMLGLPMVAGGAAAFAAPARVSVAVPPEARSAAVVMLELAIVAPRTSAAGHLGAVVRIGRPGQAVEVGRVSIVPTGGGNEQRYQFNVADAVRWLDLAGRAAEVEVVPIERGGGRLPPGVTLAIKDARIVIR